MCHRAPQDRPRSPRRFERSPRAAAAARPRAAGGSSHRRRAAAQRRRRDRRASRAAKSRRVERGEAPLLLALGVEVLPCKPALEGGFARRPFGIDDRIPGGVAILALHHLVLTEQALVLEAEAQRGALGRLIAIVAFPLVAPVAERKSVLADQVHRLGGGGGTLERRR